MFSVNKEKCIGCSQCVKDCPVSTISLVDNKAEINNERCFKCGHCIAICPVEAVSTDDYNMEDVIPYDNDSFTVEADNLLNFIKFRRILCLKMSLFALPVDDQRSVLVFLLQGFHHHP